MSKTILGLDNPIFGFKKTNEDKVSIDVEIIPADYNDIEKINAELRELCEKQAKADLKALAISTQTFVGD